MVVGAIVVELDLIVAGQLVAAETEVGVAEIGIEIGAFVLEPLALVPLRRHLLATPSLGLAAAAAAAKAVAAGGDC